MATTTEQFNFFRRKTKTRTFNSNPTAELESSLQVSDQDIINLATHSAVSLRDRKSKNSEFLRLATRIT